MIADGSYLALHEKYGLEDIMVDEAVVNPDVEH